MSTDEDEVGDAPMLDGAAALRDLAVRRMMVALGLTRKQAADALDQAIAEFHRGDES